MFIFFEEAFVNLHCQVCSGFQDTFDT